jgi:hypothetical protein
VGKHRLSLFCESGPSSIPIHYIGCLHQRGTMSKSAQGNHSAAAAGRHRGSVNVEYRTVGRSDILLNWGVGAIRAHRRLILEGLAPGRSAAFGRRFR